MLKRALVGISVLVAVAQVGAGAVARDLQATEIAGRWTGASYSDIRSGTLTLDIVACGAGWCGIKVEAGDKCGGTALKLNTGVVEENNAQFQGTLSLASGPEPYTVHATIFPPEDGKPLEMQVTGDTGGEYRAFRRSFPFEAALARVQDAVCHAPETVSLLDQD
jgi:hypothetical protein